ncbi:MAG TPA: hypothetical protein VF598_04420 [Hymenobacter sp.]|jgi:hypothetical protein
MPKLFTVRIDECTATTYLQTIGKKKPLLSLEEVRQFLVEYARTWKQAAPPPVEFIEAQFEAQRAEIECKDGPSAPGERECRFTLYPYANPREGEEIIEHVISIKEFAVTAVEWKKGGESK